MPLIQSRNFRQALTSKSGPRQRAASNLLRSTASTVTNWTVHLHPLPLPDFFFVIVHATNNDHLNLARQPPKMSQTVGRVSTPPTSASSPQSLHTLLFFISRTLTNCSNPTDPARLLPSLAPRFPLLALHPHPRPPRLPHRNSPNGQAQTDLGPFNRLRRLRGRNWLLRRPRNGQEDAAKEIL